MRTRAFLAALTLAVAACSDSNIFSPPAQELPPEPSLAVSDAESGGPDGFWFLPPLVKQVTTTGELDLGLEPSMSVCLLDGNPSASVNPDWAAVDCVSPLVVATEFAAGTAKVSGTGYQFSWNTSPGAPENLIAMDADRFYRVRILLEGAVLGYLDVNPQHPNGQTPGEDYPDLYAFRLGENLPVKFFATTQARCALSETADYVIQCVAQGVVDQNGGVVTLEPSMEGWPKISTVVPANALPAEYDAVVLTMERIDPAAFLEATGEKCIPGLPGFSGFDAPQFGDCLRVTTDPVLPVELEAAALIEICVLFDPTSYPELKFLEEQDARLQIIRYSGAETQGLPNVDATTCGSVLPDPSVLGLFPVPEQGGPLRTAAIAANRLARWMAPEPLAAHGDIRLAGATTEFSRFRWGLPGQMIRELGDGIVIQQLEDGSESYTNAVQVKVVDAGSPDSGLEPSAVEGATVHYSGSGTVSPTDVVTGADGLAATVWTVPSIAGVHTLDAKALGLLATPVPGHATLIDFEESKLTFSATVVGGPAASTQSPDASTVLEGLPGETLATPLVITVLDENGNPVVGWPVTWETGCSASDPSICDGFVGDDQDGDPTNDTGAHLLTDANGQSTAYWTLATVPGANTLQVNVGSESLDFVAARWDATGGCAVQVDGRIDAREWDCALATGDALSFTANLSGGATPAEVRWQTRDDQLYFLVTVEQSALANANSLRIDFDNALNGPSADDDVIGFVAGGSGFFDQYLGDRCANRSQSGCGVADSGAGGSTDGVGAIGNDGIRTVYELSHPLSSGDLRDFTLAAGDATGFFLTLSIGNGAQGNTQFPGFRQYQTVRIR